ncbi:MAG: hypothetical protein KC466_05365 [Myxococcales bacterium]|nr:hypothetical protein [Myxococcales bacterium]
MRIRAFLFAILFLAPVAASAQALPWYCWNTPDDELIPVILFENKPSDRRMDPLVSLLKDCGWTDDKIFYIRVFLPVFPFICNEDTAVDIRNAIQGVVNATGYDHVDVLGYSLQAMTVRYAISALGGWEQVRNVVLWGSPNNGGSNLLLTGWCYLDQLAPNTDFVRCTNGDAFGEPGCANPFDTATPHARQPGDPVEDGVLYVNMYSKDDLLMSASELLLHDDAVNLEFPVVPHGNYPDDPRVQNETIGAFVGKVVPHNCGSLPAGRANVGAALWVLAGMAPLGWIARRRRGVSS